ncbi:DUF2207 domain-containing protein [Gordonia sp. ABSL49_1]|uniref:DUF2207 domain-containing protein n=1 Tax=Gordonia sp. ABSL49_1 TaxID=2920941 RepID=UPI001F0F1F4D|nr:DUF2207 domain-containing protein [Gordonia sp. ABSL49_1]MCH5642928.1 DUF2207 domain-containing protein [Gordonia sp. ABSL49_1]
MKRVLMSVAVAVLALIGLAIPLIDVDDDAGSGVDPVSITEYRAEYRVAADGRLTARETITADFPASRHGIFRFWDVTDSADSHVRYIPENITVALDDGSVPVDFSWESGKRFRVAKIGDPDRYLTPGIHTYVITYEIAGAIAPSSAEDMTAGSWSGGDTSRFLWRVVPDGWRMAIARSETVVDLPEAPLATACRTRDGTACTITRSGPTQFTVTTGALHPNTGVTFRADLPSAAPERDATAWPVFFDPILGRSLWVAIVLALLSLLTFGIGVAWVLRSRESTPLLPVMYEPPTDPQRPGGYLGPVQSYFVTRERMPKRALVATLLYLADRGYVRLDRDGTEWTVTSLVDSSAWQQIDAPSRAAAGALYLTGEAGRSFTTDGSVDAGEKLQAATGALASATSKWAAESGAINTSRFEWTGRALVALALVVAAVLFFFQWLPFSLLVLPIAAFAIGGAGLYAAGVGTRRTLLGRDIWSRAGGFERLISTTSNQERLDFSARRELYTDYIPYAVAFDCADAWAKKYRIATGSEPPVPVWFVPTSSSTTHGFFGDASGFDSFESSLSSSLSAYSATQSSSSSGGGGGGFSGGGGGGGGGSW